MVETAGITTEQWESVVARLSEDDRVSKSNLGFVKLIDVQGLLGETLYLQVANEMIRGNTKVHTSRVIQVSCSTPNHN